MACRRPDRLADAIAARRQRRMETTFRLGEVAPAADRPAAATHLSCPGLAQGPEAFALAMMTPCYRTACVRLATLSLFFMVSFGGYASERMNRVSVIHVPGAGRVVK